MIRGIWGKKIGMTQVFSDDKLIPITVVDTSSWVVVGTRKKSLDGYNALRVGRIKLRYANDSFSAEWIKKPNRYFSVLKEIVVNDDDEDVLNFTVGETIDFYESFSVGDKLRVSGISKGCGFMGVIKRHGFAGGPKSHGSTMGRAPGSIGFMASQGKVIKGKKLPGRMGNQKTVVQNLELIDIKSDSRILLIKGAIPGKPGSLIFIEKS